MSEKQFGRPIAIRDSEGEVVAYDLNPVWDRTNPNHPEHEEEGDE